MPPNAVLYARAGSSITTTAPKSATCQICLEESHKDNDNHVVTQFCSDACPAVICTQCLVKYMQVSMEVPYTGALPKIRCPICLVPANKQRWTRYATLDEVISKIAVRYTELCEAACSLTCPNCHNSSYTQLPVFYSSASTDLANLELLKLRPSDKRKLPALRRVVSQFAQHDKTVNARDVVRHISERFPSEKRDCIVKKVLQRIEDEERRATLLLSYHSIERHVVTRCCGVSVCFNCKRRWWETDKPCTCETQDEEELTDYNCVVCRSCRVMLVKVDGCDSVRCICGFDMDWGEEQRLSSLNKRKLLPVDPFDTTMLYYWEIWQRNLRGWGDDTFSKMRAQAMLFGLNRHRPYFREALRRLLWRQRFRRIVLTAEREMRDQFVHRVYPTFKEALRALVWRRRRFHNKLLAECRVGYVVRKAKQAAALKPLLLKLVWYSRYHVQVMGSLLRHFYLVSRGWEKLTEEQQEVEEEQLALLSIGLD